MRSPIKIGTSQLAPTNVAGTIPVSIGPSPTGGSDGSTLPSSSANLTPSNSSMSLANARLRYTFLIPALFGTLFALF